MSPSKIARLPHFNSIFNYLENPAMTPVLCSLISQTSAPLASVESVFAADAYKKEEFMQHYHQRSNVESTFSMVKAKFGHSVRSKTDVAMANEVLCKFICHNICCLISAMYELGIQPVFG